MGTEMEMGTYAGAKSNKWLYVKLGLLLEYSWGMPLYARRGSNKQQLSGRKKEMIFSAFGRYIFGTTRENLLYALYTHFESV